uniref:Uncharacterized protein n=1 Tax=Aegilops tauschii subsp. strangulata TaxID=200361 RepID=A0A453IWK9_AEGTS
PPQSTVTLMPGPTASRIPSAPRTQLPPSGRRHDSRRPPRYTTPSPDESRGHIHSLLPPLAL